MMALRATYLRGGIAGAALAGIGKHNGRKLYRPMHPRTQPHTGS